MSAQYLPVPRVDLLAVGRDVTDVTSQDQPGRQRSSVPDLATIGRRRVGFVMNHLPTSTNESSVENILGSPPSMFLDDLTQFLDISMTRSAPSSRGPSR